MGQAPLQIILAMLDVLFKVVCTNNRAPLEMEGTSRMDEEVEVEVEGEVEGATRLG
jgi:hypothetical protein